MTYRSNLYDSPRRGLFRVTTDTYTTLGWETKEVEAEIVGEDEHLYIVKVKRLKYGRWYGRIVLPVVVPCAHGFHKTRLIKWLPNQLSLNL